VVWKSRRHATRIAPATPVAELRHLLTCTTSTSPQPQSRCLTMISRTNLASCHVREEIQSILERKHLLGTGCLRASTRGHARIPSHRSCSCLYISPSLPPTSKQPRLCMTHRFTTQFSNDKTWIPTQSSGSRPSSRPLHPLTYTFNRLPKIPIAIVHLSEQETTDRVAGRRRSQYGSLYEDLASALRLFSYQASMRYGPHIYTQIHSPPPA
jgi:hypothetical protein